ncbi:hypothetical protein [Calditerricola satsumensis]|uniref:hypothetical protein n=1 Tax=Calditerricola satsumensis TaxID=373054 RepID=UPI00210D26B0|nr:hypothetical protein [Calditerricola satsumensis]
MGFDKALVDEQVLDALKTIGYDIGADEVNLAKVRLFEEAVQPIRTGARVREPVFAEVRDMLVKVAPRRGWCSASSAAPSPSPPPWSPSCATCSCWGKGGGSSPKTASPSSLTSAPCSSTPTSASLADRVRANPSGCASCSRS